MIAFRKKVVSFVVSIFFCNFAHVFLIIYHEEILFGFVRKQPGATQ